MPDAISPLSELSSEKDQQNQAPTTGAEQPQKKRRKRPHRHIRIMQRQQAQQQAAIPAWNHGQAGQTISMDQNEYQAVHPVRPSSSPAGDRIDAGPAADEEGIYATSSTGGNQAGTFVRPTVAPRILARRALDAATQLIMEQPAAISVRRPALRPPWLQPAGDDERAPHGMGAPSEAVDQASPWRATRVAQNRRQHLRESLARAAQRSHYWHGRLAELSTQWTELNQDEQ